LRIALKAMVKQRSEQLRIPVKFTGAIAFRADA